LVQRVVVRQTSIMMDKLARIRNMSRGAVSIQHFVDIHNPANPPGIKSCSQYLDTINPSSQDLLP